MATSRIIPAPGHYIIRDDATGKVSYWQSEYHQSAADRTGVSTADYIHAMYFFLMQAGVRDVLMIGCGGGTLATMLARSNVAGDGGGPAQASASISRANISSCLKL